MASGKIDKIQNIQAKQNESKIANKENSEDFKKLLDQYIAESRELKGSSLPKGNTSPLVNKNSFYSSFNKLKVNHLDKSNENSTLVQKLLAQEKEGSSSKIKLEEIKQRLNDGFYLKEDVIEDLSGVIMDSFLR